MVNPTLEKAFDWIYEHADKNDFPKAVIRILQNGDWEEIGEANKINYSTDIDQVISSLKSIIEILHSYGFAENILNAEPMGQNDFFQTFYPDTKGRPENKYALANWQDSNGIKEWDYPITELDYILDKQNEKENTKFVIVAFNSGDCGIRILEIPQDKYDVVLDL